MAGSVVFCPELRAREREDKKKECEKMIRRAGNRGSFYPGSCEEILKMIDHFNAILDKSLKEKDILKNGARAIIAPHAGYIYSGFTANIAHRILSAGRPKRIVVIGPSHHIYFEGISGSMLDEYESPCGNLPIDREYLEHLAGEFPLVYAPDAHLKEHSTETQIPFIRYYHKDVKVIELIYAKTDYIDLVPLIEKVLSDPESAVVISSDLSHFHTLEYAKKIDNICLAGVAEKSIATLESGCEACGIIGIKAIIAAAAKHGWQTELLDYRTSADASGDTERVVGYMSAAIRE
jgi:AmmeMemoRadiSam system protein B